MKAKIKQTFEENQPVLYKTRSLSLSPGEWEVSTFMLWCVGTKNVHLFIRSSFVHAFVENLWSKKCVQTLGLSIMNFCAM